MHDPFLFPPSQKNDDVWCNGWWRTMTWVWSPCLILVTTNTKDWIQRSGQDSRLWEERERNSLLCSRLGIHHSSSPGWSSLRTSHFSPNPSNQPRPKWVSHPASWCTQISPLSFMCWFPISISIALYAFMHFKSKRYGRNWSYFSRIFQLGRIIKWLGTVNVECLELWVNYSVGHKRIAVGGGSFWGEITVNCCCYAVAWRCCNTTWHLGWLRWWTRKEVFADIITWIIVLLFLAAEGIITAKTSLCSV